MLTALEILGLRGFAAKQSIRFAVPNGKSGSGLTVIVGANNAGKSTVIEALRSILREHPAPSFSQSRRNLKAGDCLSIRVLADENRATIVQSTKAGSSETVYTKENGGVDINSLMIVPSRRTFSPHFSGNEINRGAYSSNMGNQPVRASSLELFTHRLFSIEKNRDAFDAVLQKVLDPVPEWTIDQADTGQHFLKIRRGDATHNSEGMGEGLISLLFIIDALYDSREGQAIVIDEPELSLHPALQRRLAALLVEYAATRQIILATHSPYFVFLDALSNGGTVVRTHTVDNATVISQLTETSARDVQGLIQNQNNPHLLGINAQEVFFMEDRIILVEGQEDVVFFKKVQESIQVPLSGSFFGWGVGGAGNMEKITAILHDLGYTRVVGIVDANHAQTAATLAKKFPNYHFFAIPANDVRSKAPVPEKAAVSGLLDDDNNQVRAEYSERVQKLFEDANRYLKV